MTNAIEESHVREALSRVEDPEIGRPITELDMVKSIAIDGNDVAVEIYLTIAGCPMKNTIEQNTRAVLEDLEGVGTVTVTMDAMNDDQRRALKKKLRGGQAEPEIPFAKPNSTTRVFAVASGKGGVGKSSMTANLGAALAARGLKVGIVDADIYGHSIPGLLGNMEPPTVIDEEMLLPPIAHGLKFISIGQFIEGNAPIVWRGPMLHRALQQSWAMSSGAILTSFSSTCRRVPAMSRCRSHSSSPTRSSSSSPRRRQPPLRSLSVPARWRSRPASVSPESWRTCLPW